MRSAERHERIAAAVDTHGFQSVHTLSQLCQVSEVTVRRDLEQLDAAGRLQRTYGGAAPLHKSPAAVAADGVHAMSRPAPALVSRYDVLISASLDPKYDALLPDLSRNAIPLIAEALPIAHAQTVVAVENYEAGRAIGRWAGQYALDHLGGRANVLDLTYHLPNTRARSQGFLNGLREIIPAPQEVVSLNPQSRYDAAYQLTRDALVAHRDLNLIFAINDTNAWGAINACRDLKLDPAAVAVIPFGLEGNTLKDAIAAGHFCPAGLAMFPEIVGPTLVEAAMAAYNHQLLPPRLVTPFAILTPANLSEFYARNAHGWELRWPMVRERLAIPLGIDCGGSTYAGPVPGRIGFLVHFMEHEWYSNLARAMRDYAACLDTVFEIVDAEQTLRDDIELRRREIARYAAQEVKTGEVIMIDGGPIAGYLAEELRQHRGITVVTNAQRVFDILSDNPDITLISTGGALRRSTAVMVGPTTESTLARLRADKLFLMVTGITLDFGLSHTDISEVTAKQAMIRSARQVILLADNTCFGHESMVQVAPPSVAHTLITDDALPASWRLEMSKLGIEVVLAGV